MSQLLKQSTAATILVGPVLDSTGAAYTSAVIGDFNITKNGTTAAMASAATATHSHTGHYLIALTTGNTDTVGRVAISCNKSTYTMGRYTATVLYAETFDAIITNTANAAGGLCDVKRFGGTSVTGRDIGASVLLSSGTGTGQITITSGVVSSDATKIGGSSTCATNMGTIFDDLEALGGLQSIGIDYYTYGYANSKLVTSQGDITFDTISVAGDIGANTITAGSFSISAANIRSSVGLASANLDTQLSDIGSGELTASSVWSYGTRYLTQDRVVTVPSIQSRHRQIIQGDTYGATGKTFTSLASDGGEWPTDLSAYTWACTISKDADNENTGSSSVTGTVTVGTSTGNSRYLIVSLTATQTGAMALGRYNYDIQGSSGAIRWTVETGTMDVIEDYTA